MMFEASYESVLEKIDQIDPKEYERTRNYADGAVTRLSPYVSRGFVSTKTVFQKLIDKGFKPAEMEKFVQELAWRDYWQQVWKSKGEDINEDLKRRQEGVLNSGVSTALLQAQTGIEAVDEALTALIESGYLHNHMRMYIASIACNIAGSHWRVPAKWMYYHLLDGDWASNALSWQWVAGANANKKYYANQENINRFFYSSQKQSFLDVAYEDFKELAVPESLQECSNPAMSTPLPKSDELVIDPNLSTLIYNYYNLDPHWNLEQEANRILLLEPKVFEAYPVSQKCIDFALSLAQSIPGIQVYVGSFQSLKKAHSLQDIYFKEHPLNLYYEGHQDERDWMFTVEGYYPSFFAFWKKCKKEITY